MTPETMEKLLFVCASSAADAVATRMDRQVHTAVGGELTSPALLRFELDFPGGAKLRWFVPHSEATALADLLVGGPGNSSATLTESHLDALSSVFSEMLERTVASLNKNLSEALEPSNIDMGMEGGVPALAEGDVESTIQYAVDGFQSISVVQRADATFVNQVQQRLQADAVEGLPEALPTSSPDPSLAMPASSGASDGSDVIDNVVPLSSGASSARRKPIEVKNADLTALMNVPLDITVELGRCERTVRDIVELSVGSIIELAKLAGDPMDIKVNGRVLARGEVVVIDEEFGVRVTEILTPEERIRKLGA